MACFCLTLVPNLKTTGDTRPGILVSLKALFQEGKVLGCPAQAGLQLSIPLPLFPEYAELFCTPAPSEVSLPIVSVELLLRGLWPFRPCVLSWSIHSMEAQHTQTLGFRWDAFSKSHIFMIPPHQTTEHFSSWSYGPHAQPQPVAIWFQRKLASGTSQVSFTLSRPHIATSGIHSWYVSLYSSN